MNYADVKSCPCCTGGATIMAKGDDIEKKWKIFCNVCGISTPEFEDSIVRDGDGIRFVIDGKDLAISCWNTRV